MKEWWKHQTDDFYFKHETFDSGPTQNLFLLSQNKTPLWITM